MSVAERIKAFKKQLPPHVKLVAVSKTHPKEKIFDALDAEHLDFGENRVQELIEKAEALPKTIKWHQIGHLQTNKVKYIAPFIHLIHAVDSKKLLKEINKEANKNNRKISVLLQVKIAKEESKFGLSFDETYSLLNEIDQNHLYPNVQIEGLMGMASFVDDTEQVRNEFRSLANFYKEQTQRFSQWKYLSMGMSGDYQIAIEEGANLIRVGSKLFGSRN